jgi:hypothetical protein
MEMLLRKDKRMAMEMRRCILDVDGTLWDLHRPLYNRLTLNFDLPSYEESLTDWNWFEPYMSKKEFYAAVDATHNEQYQYPAFDGAHELFQTLHRMDLEVIVASHRQPQTAARLAWWLGNNELYPYSGVLTSHDKLFLIRRGDIVIDDAPKTIAYAWNNDASIHYLRWPWNSGMVGAGYDNLYELIGGLNEKTIN